MKNRRWKVRAIRLLDLDSNSTVNAQQSLAHYETMGTMSQTLRVIYLMLYVKQHTASGSVGA